MTLLEELLAEAQRLLDLRQDPLAEDDFCDQLERCPQALTAVVEMRAALFCATAAQPVARKFYRYWPGGIAAAVLWLVFSTLQTEKETAPSTFSTPHSPSSAILFWHQSTESSLLNPQMGADVFRVAVTTSHSQKI